MTANPNAVRCAFVACHTSTLTPVEHGWVQVVGRRGALRWLCARCSKLQEPVRVTLVDRVVEVLRRDPDVTLAVLAERLRVSRGHVQLARTRARAHLQREAEARERAREAGRNARQWAVAEMLVDIGSRSVKVAVSAVSSSLAINSVAVRSVVAWNAEVLVRGSVASVIAEVCDGA